MMNRLIIIVLVVILSMIVLFGYYSKFNPVEQEFVELESSCLIQEGKCRLNYGDININISSDENIFYLHPFEIEVVLENTKATKVVADFKMNDMDMGINRVMFTQGYSDVQWVGTYTLPVCVSGRVDWNVEIEVYTGVGNYKVILPVHVKKK